MIKLKKNSQLKKYKKKTRVNRVNLPTHDTIYETMLIIYKINHNKL
jgi:hypothetical protein